MATDELTRLKSIVETAVDGIITIDDRGIIHSFLRHRNPIVWLRGRRSHWHRRRKVDARAKQRPTRRLPGTLEWFMEAGIKQNIGIGREVVGQRKDGSTFPMRFAVGAFWHGGQKWFTGTAHNLNEFTTVRQIMATTHAQRPTDAKRNRFHHANSELRKSVLQLRRTEIDFISNPEFLSDFDRSQELVDETLAASEKPSKFPADLPAHLQRMCESELLSPEEERVLFREMNFLKYRANALRARLNPDAVDPQAIEKIESLLARAQRIRDHIISANLRLVMSIVKNFVTPQQSFDDLLSEGITTLMQAVDKFDYDRGFRFSTYTYRSIARRAYRTVTTAQKEGFRFTRNAEDWAFELENDQSSSTMTDQVWSNLRDRMTLMLDKLDRRERFIIRSRYALGAHRKVRTFQCLADKLGVSKERVRQLEQRAVAKLQAMAVELETDELFTAALA